MTFYSEKCLKDHIQCQAGIKSESAARMAKNLIPIYLYSPNNTVKCSLSLLFSLIYFFLWGNAQSFAKLKDIFYWFCCDQKWTLKKCSKDHMRFQDLNHSHRCYSRCKANDLLHVLSLQYHYLIQYYTISTNKRNTLRI